MNEWMTKTCNTRSCRTSRIWGADHNGGSLWLEHSQFIEENHSLSNKQNSKECVTCDVIRPKRVNYIWYCSEKRESCGFPLQRIGSKSWTAPPLDMLLVVTLLWVFKIQTCWQNFGSVWGRMSVEPRCNITSATSVSHSLSGTFINTSNISVMNVSCPLGI